MLYLAIDLHRKQMTINVRSEDGEPILRRQVSTWGQDPQTFLADVQRRAGQEGFVAILEVCGFHDWLTELLPQFGAIADDLCVVRSMHTGHDNHTEGTILLNTGKFTIGRPALGSWACGVSRSPTSTS
jgi:hypothetical protein